MPRRRRIYISGLPVHVVQRGINREPCFNEAEDYQRYLQFLGEALFRYPAQLHAYCLMTNHIHLLLTPQEGDAISRVIMHLGRCYVQYYNAKYKRSGPLWEGRHKGSIIQDNNYLLTCYRYIELNPVKARMVHCPSKYLWSSYHFNALLKKDDLISPHPVYQALASNSQPAHVIYNESIINRDQTMIDREISESLSKNWPVGEPGFIEMVSSQLGGIGYKKRGRPVKDGDQN